MSDSVLKIIPKDPAFVPDAHTHDAAVLTLERIAPGEMCEAEVYDIISFIDQGENLEAIICPHCGEKTGAHDFPIAQLNVESWFEIDFDDISPSEQEVTMPCCASTVRMTDLSFDWPGAFARFELSIWNPDISGSLDAQQLAELETILSCKLQQVHAHY